MNLSIWGMYQHADIIVKAVIICLLLSSIVTWTIFFYKGNEILKSKKRLYNELIIFRETHNLKQAINMAMKFTNGNLITNLLIETIKELDLSTHITSNNKGIKERIALRLERKITEININIGKGNGFLATIGAISPFIGLFGTIWGVMNSFIGIAHSQNTNLSIVAPGLSEALMVTAIGLLVAIPAVVIYNIFIRAIINYKFLINDCAKHILLLFSRDLDIATASGNRITISINDFKLDISS